jgi:hypothetical protein
LKMHPQIIQLAVGVERGAPSIQRAPPRSKVGNSGEMIGILSGDWFNAMILALTSRTLVSIVLALPTYVTQKDGYPKLDRAAVGRHIKEHTS